MHLELVRTFPISRSRGYDFMRDTATWASWTPVVVGEDEETFVFRPMKGFGFTGSLAVVDEVPHETVGFVFDARGFPPVDMRWTFSHAGPGAFTVRIDVKTEAPDWNDKLLEALTLMGPSIRGAVTAALDRLEHHFLGDVDVTEPVPVG